MSHMLAKLALPGMAAAFSAIAATAAIALLSASPAWSQDQDQAGEPAPAAENADGVAGNADGVAGEGPADPASGEAESGDGGPAVGLDEIPELDRQTHEEDDDDFVPTEEIPVDQSIPFPTDI